MTLDDFGYTATIAAFADAPTAAEFQAGRIVSEQKERYCVITAGGEYDAEITGNLRFTARNREDFPATGDWVLFSLVGSNFAIIHSVLPRYSIIKRKAPEQNGEFQIIATNIDYALIVQSADRDFNLNRLERYLAICNDSRIQPVIVITKIDLNEESQIQTLRTRIQERIVDTPIFFLSNETRVGLDELKQTIVKGKTYCLLGSSGAGKSTLLNSLCGAQIMKTGKTSDSTGKGRHTTSSRELVVCNGGGIFIDNPGMREVGMTDNEAGLDRTFSRMRELSRSCKFSSCTHIHEKGCAILEALHSGVLDPDLYANFLKMEKEKTWFSSNAAEKHKRDKDFGKNIKKYNRDKRMNKF